MMIEAKVLTHIQERPQKGFSLLGVIIALFITTVGLVAILALANAALREASASRMRLITAGLAQEGIEMIRGLRRTQIEWDDWYNSLTSGDYLIEYNSSDLESYSVKPLKLDTVSGLYQYTFGDDTPFYRKITLTKISSDELKVEVKVEWQLRGRNYSLTVEDRLWNWK